LADGGGAGSGGSEAGRVSQSIRSRHAAWWALSCVGIAPNVGFAPMSRMVAKTTYPEMD
jgi:hypothetical protein